MGKNIEGQLQDAVLKNKKLLKRKAEIVEQIKQNETIIKSLQKKKKQTDGENILQKIEAHGFTVEDVLKIMEEKQNEEEK